MSTQEWTGKWEHFPFPAKDESLIQIARKIAAEQSRQTGKNYAAFIEGRYDHAYGVRTAMAALKYARDNR
jgi:predicted phosphatase